MAAIPSIYTTTPHLLTVLIATIIAFNTSHSFLPKTHIYTKKLLHQTFKMKSSYVLASIVSLMLGVAIASPTELASRQKAPGVGDTNADVSQFSTTFHLIQVRS